MPIGSLKDREDDRRDHEFQLLKDYTEGRIEQMPYRPSHGDR
jgi:hypothetical protein